VPENSKGKTNENKVKFKIERTRNKVLPNVSRLQQGRQTVLDSNW
jgi:hypothetical protein